MNGFLRFYEVSILNASYKDISAKTAQIKFFNKSGGVINVLEYAYLEAAEVYEKIQNNEPVILDNCYIKDFSLSTFKKNQNIADNEYIKLKGFSAENAFFDCEFEVDFSHAEFQSAKISFKNTRFGDGNKRFYKTVFGEGDIDFSNTYWGRGNVDFQMAEIDKGNINFENARFSEGDISFVNTHFGDGKVNFKNVRFGDGEVDFHYSRFGKGVKTFDKAQFGKGLKDFRKIEFGSGRLDFKRVYFNDGDVLFDESEIISGKCNFRGASFGNGKISFDLTNFGKDEVLLEKIDFSGKILSFYQCWGNIVSLEGCQLNCFIDLRVNHIKYLNLSNTILRDIIDLKKVDTPQKIDRINLHGMRNLGQILIDWKENNVYNAITNNKEHSMGEIAEQFLLLKENFNNTGQYNDEDRAYVAFKRFELEHITTQKIAKNPKNKYWMLPLYWFEKLVFDKMGLYATAPLRVFVSMTIVFSVYSIIYTIVPYISSSEIICPQEYTDFLHRLGNAFYYSAITFLTVGYGDCLPTGIFKVLAPLEGWMGVFMMSYFTVAFVRKILR